LSFSDVSVVVEFMFSSQESEGVVKVGVLKLCESLNRESVGALQLETALQDAVLTSCAGWRSARKTAPIARTRAADVARRNRMRGKPPEDWAGCGRNRVG
jgi:hypothetical protein